MPFPSFEESAKCLDNRRLGKQRVEVRQILEALIQGPFSPCPNCGDEKPTINLQKNGFHCYNCEAKLIKTAWYNHPATKMWKGYETELVRYGLAMIKEWTNRGYKDTQANVILDLIDAKEFSGPATIPKWIGDDKFHLAHKSNLIRKNPLHYRPIFGVDIPDNLPYYWPA